MKLDIRTISATVLLTASTAAAQVQVDQKIAAYAPTEGVSGTIKSIGSDTMNNLMTLWGEGFRGHYPSVRLEVEGKGSSTGPPALISGSAQFAPMSREMKAAERDDFEAKYGYKPTQLKTSIDMLAVYVHKDNPIEKLSIAEVDAIFSKSRSGGHPADITTWGDLGLTGDWADKPISVYGRNSASGTYGYFKEHALFDGDFKDTVKEQPGSASVVQSVASDKYAIGYSGIGYKTADVRTVALASGDGEAVPATPEYAYSGEYPLARFLYLYVNHDPGADLDPLRREFIRYVMSRQGQSDVVKDGYYPLPASIVEAQTEEINLGDRPDGVAETPK
jgi:phosphate transport system substrate-binding protein